MAFNNMVNVAVDPSLEEKLYLDEVAAVKQWWADSRWRYTKRPFTAEQIVAKRGNLKIEYASNTQSKKLWKILEGRFQVCRDRFHQGDKANYNDTRTKMPAIPTAAWNQPC
jgi:isocitrate lyase